MPHASVRLIPGVDQNETPALNQAAFSTSNLIRFIYDRQQGAIAQKLGGWTKFFPNAAPAAVRALWAWEDTQGTSHLAYGTQNQVSPVAAQLATISNGAFKDITPTFAQSNTTAAAATVVGSSYVTITDLVTVGITGYDTVYFPVQVSVGGIVLFGQYQCDPNGYLGANTYTVQATDILGNPVLATATTAVTTLPQIATTSGVTSVTVTLNNHGYSVGSEFPVIMSTTVGGATFLGHYPVVSVPTANTFTITAQTVPTATTTGYINANVMPYIYNFGVGAVPLPTGFGGGGYGSGTFGGSGFVASSGTAVSAYDWTLDNWGEALLACPLRTTTPQYQPITVWDSEAGAPQATVIAAAPPINDGFFTAMPQRQIVAWGSTFDGIQDQLLVRWCDVNNYNVWAGTVTNQAGSYRIPKGSHIVSMLQGPQQALLWTDVGVWTMQYVGLPYVYSFNEVGTGCGLIARKAAATINSAVYWMGPSQFYVLSSDGVAPVPCPIWDTIFQDLDQTNLNKIRVAVNSRFGEVTWYFPTISSGGEVSMYAKFNPTLNTWDFGTLGRSAWIDQSVLGAPIGADPVTNYLYQHETSTDADGAAMLSSAQTGYFAISDGDYMTFVDQVWPDMKWGYYGGTQNATVNLTFYVANYPGDTPQTYGPYAVNQTTQYISPRFRGRLVSVKISSNDTGSFWRMGNIRYRLSPDGRF